MKKFKRENHFPIYAATCFYVLIGCAICSALFLYGSSLLKNSRAARLSSSQSALFETPASDDTSPATEQASSSETQTDSETSSEEEPAYYSFVTLNIRSVLHVRIRPGMDADIIWRLSPGSTGYVLEPGEEWSLIKTPDVTGYVSNQYLQFTEIPKEEYLQNVEALSQ